MVVLTIFSPLGFRGAADPDGSVPVVVLAGVPVGLVLVLPVLSEAEDELVFLVDPELGELPDLV